MMSLYGEEKVANERNTEKLLTKSFEQTSTLGDKRNKLDDAKKRDTQPLRNREILFEKKIQSTDIHPGSTQLPLFENCLHFVYANIDPSIVTKGK